MALNKKEYEDLKLSMEKEVNKYVSADRSTITSLIVHALDSSVDKRKLETRLMGYVDKNIAYKLANKAFSKLEELAKKNSTKKRQRDEDTKDSKKPRYKENEDDSTRNSAKTDSSTNIKQQQQIKDVLAKAQADIEERKRAIAMQRLTTQPTVQAAHTPDVSSRIAQLQARIHAQLGQNIAAPGDLIPKPTLLSSAELPKFIPPPPPVTSIIDDTVEKPANIILDAEGRTLDVTGKEVHLSHRVPTLKANIRAKKREEFKLQLQEKPIDDSDGYFDNRIKVKPFVKSRRAFHFNEEGKYIQQAQKERAKARLEKLHEQISQVAKKTGISSAAKIAQLETREQKEYNVKVPQIEWWDKIIMDGDRYPNEGEPVKVKEGLITELVEHPMEMKGPKDLDKKVSLELFLTKKERKKLRRMTRREAWKEKQEKIRLGLEPHPEPKVRMANLMRVLGTEAVLDPTKMEKHVREQMAKRKQAHEDANNKRKLTRDQRREKKIKKLKEDVSAGVQVAIYRVSDLSNGSHKFKVETNAKQLYLTGTVVLFKDVNVIIVEGGPKQQQKYKKLMLERIRWNEKARSAKDSTVEGKCQLIWEGATVDRHFNDIQFKSCPTEAFAREHFRKHGVEHYWDLAFGSKILEEAEEIV